MLAPVVWPELPHGSGQGPDRQEYFHGSFMQSHCHSAVSCSIRDRRQPPGVSARLGILRVVALVVRHARGRRTRVR